MFSHSSQAIIYGKHLDVAERMLDFDFLSGREVSIWGFIDPNAKKKSMAKLFFWDREILIPIFRSFDDVPRNTNIDTLINLASFRSAIDVTWEAIENELFETIIIIAEGIPERDIREVISWNANEKSEGRAWVRIVWPATAWVIAGGVLRMWNAWWSLENIVESRLYKQWSVWFVSKSGGMSNEMYRVISKHTNGIHTGIALGGDRYTSSTFSDIVIEYEQIPEITMIVMLWEVWGQDELSVAEMIRDGRVTKPIVAYVSGVFAEYLTTEVQFGHAGAKANEEKESASYKNKILKESWAHVPESYMDLWDLIASTAKSLGIEGTHRWDTSTDIEKKLIQIRSRKSTKFTSTISDERGEDLHYGGRKIDDYIASGSIGKVIGTLWLKRDLPDYAARFIDTIIILLADHGPAVSGATNTIITARAGKDILSSLVSGLMTIGPRFGGAIDGAARHFYEAVHLGETPETFIARIDRKSVV